MFILNKKINIKTKDKYPLEIVYSIEESIVNGLTIYNLNVNILNSKNKEDNIFIEGITASKEIAKDIFNKLIKFKVTPTTLVNILDDYFYEIYNS